MTTRTQTFKQGYLIKQGGSTKQGGWKTWKKRWFVLHNEGVSYYKSREGFLSSQDELGFLHREEAFEVTENFTDVDRSLFMFKNKTRTLPVKAASEQQKEEWLAAWVTMKKDLQSSVVVSRIAKEEDADSKREERLEKLLKVVPNTEGVICAGYMSKQGHQRKNWKVRFFILLQNHLSYYKHHKETNPHGTIPLSPLSVCSVHSELLHAFVVVSKPNDPVYNVIAKDDKDRLRWMQALTVAQPKMKVFFPQDNDLTNRKFVAHSHTTLTQVNSKSIKEGYLLKIGAKVAKWKRRYFVLLCERIEYYKDPRDKTPHNTAVLGEGDKAGPYADTNFFVDLQGKRTFVLSAADNEERTAWLSALQQASEKMKVTFPVQEWHIKEVEKILSFILSSTGKAASSIQQQFVEHCQRARCEENAQFCLAVEQFKRIQDDDDQCQRKAQASQIYAQFLAEDAEERIGLTPPLEKEIEKHRKAFFDTPLPSLFRLPTLPKSEAPIPLKKSHEHKQAKPSGSVPINSPSSPKNASSTPNGNTSNNIYNSNTTAHNFTPTAVTTAPSTANSPSLIPKPAKPQRSANYSQTLTIDLRQLRLEGDTKPAPFLADLSNVPPAKPPRNRTPDPGSRAPVVTPQVESPRYQPLSKEDYSKTMSFDSSLLEGVDGPPPKPSRAVRSLGVGGRLPSPNRVPPSRPEMPARSAPKRPDHPGFTNIASPKAGARANSPSPSSGGRAVTPLTTLPTLTPLLPLSSSRSTSSPRNSFSSKIGRPRSLSPQPSSILRPDTSSSDLLALSTATTPADSIPAKPSKPERKQSDEETQLEVKVAPELPAVLPPIEFATIFDNAYRYVFTLLRDAFMPGFMMNIPDSEVRKWGLSVQADQDRIATDILTKADILRILCDVSAKTQGDRLDFRRTFLLHFHSFAQTTEVLDYIISVYNETTLSPSNLADMEFAISSKMHLASLLEEWTKNYFSDFGPQSLLVLSAVVGWIDQASKHKPQSSTLVNKLLELKDSLDNEELACDSSIRSRHDVSTLQIAFFVDEVHMKGDDLLAAGPDKVAGWLTVFDYYMFRKLKPREFVNKGWTREESRMVTSPNLMFMIRQYTQRGYWAASEVMRQEAPSQATKMLTHFMHILDKLARYRNFFGVFALTNGLGLAPVGRLKYIMQGLGAKEKKIWESMLRITDSRRNYYVYRDLLKKGLGSPQIPHIAVTLKDCFQCEEISTFGVAGKINFHKFEKQYLQISDLCRSQEAVYGTRALLSSEGDVLNSSSSEYDDVRSEGVVQALLPAFEGANCLDEEQLWVRSYQLMSKDSKIPNPPSSPDARASVRFESKPGHKSNMSMVLPLKDMFKSKPKKGDPIGGQGSTPDALSTSQSMTALPPESGPAV